LATLPRATVLTLAAVPPATVPTPYRCLAVSAGCEAHKLPAVGGKVFDVREEFNGLKAAGAITFPKQLENSRAAGFKPPGKTTKVGGLPAVYPHFA
jgi:hypothetical protein